MDLRYQFLLLSLAPIGLWIGAVTVIALGHDAIFAYILAASLGAVGVFLTRSTARIIRSSAGKTFSPSLQGIDDENWIVVELETIGLEHKIHLVSHDMGVAIRTPNGIRIVTLTHQEFAFPRDGCRLVDNSKSLGCTTRIVTGEPPRSVFDFAITPHCSTDDKAINADPREKAQWFARWLDIPYIPTVPGSPPTNG